MFGLSSVAFSPDGKKVLAAGYQRGSLWSALLPGEVEPFAFTELPSGGWFEQYRPLTLRVGVTATVGEVSYQWLKDSYYVADATNATYSIPSLDAGDAGWYTCLVQDDNGVHVPDPVYVRVFEAGSLPAATFAGVCLCGLACLGLGAALILGTRQGRGY
jgi:hypothetical protein